MTLNVQAFIYAGINNPKWVEPQSIMPPFSWYFEVTTKDGGPVQNINTHDSNILIQPKPEAVALVAYLQWLGSEVMKNRYEGPDSDIVMPPVK